jgi:outer membrane protein OmpA-like peptidoglycan-associated protein
LRLRAAPLAAALLLAACATPVTQPPRPALFAVVPGADGHIGAIVVQAEGERRVIDKAYGAQRILPDGTVRAEQLSEAQVRRDFGPTLDALPGRPASFTLYFLEGRDELTEVSRAELERVFSELRRRPLPDVMVIGHTDTVGGLAYNDRLSLARAERLREMLVSLGIPAERIQAAGRGKREPLVATDENVSEPRNRRVEISVR